MAFNGRYNFKSRVAEWTFKFGAFILALNLIAWIINFDVNIFTVAVAIICLGFSYLMEREMRK